MESSEKPQNQARSKLKSRRTITSSEVADWLRASAAGETLAAIATRAGVDVRTVSRHVAGAQQELELAAVRLGMVRAAADAHQEALLGVAASLEASLSPANHPLHASLELTAPLIRSAGKLYAALVRHTIGSGLPHALTRWEAAAKRYDSYMDRLRQRLQSELAVTDLDPEGALHELVVRITPCVALGELPSDELAWHVQAGDLRKGAFRLLGGVNSDDDPRAIDARAQYATIWQKVSTWEEVKDLCDLPAAAPLRQRLVDELEDIRLRRYLGLGACSWCPGARHPRRHATGTGGHPRRMRVRS